MQIKNFVRKYDCTKNVQNLDILKHGRNFIQIRFDTSQKKILKNGSFK